MLIQDSVLCEVGGGEIGRHVDFHQVDVEVVIENEVEANEFEEVVFRLVIAH